MMLAAVIKDVFHWLDRPPSAEVISCCDLWLHGLDTLKSRNTVPHQVDVLWRVPQLNRVCQMPTSGAAHPPLLLAALSHSLTTNSKSNLTITSAGAPQVVCFDPLSGKGLSPKHPTSAVRPCLALLDQMSFPGNWVTPNLQDLEDAVPLTHRADPLPPNLSLIPISNQANLPGQWRQAVANADVAILVAPQPTMQAWMAILGPLAKRVWGVPPSLLSKMEDKRHLTSVPSQLISTPDWNSESNVSPSFPQSVQSTACHDVAAAWFRQHLADSITWALKPTDQCGGSDVWKIRLAKPISDWGTAIGLIRFLRQKMPCETSINQTLLLSSWIEGTAGSLSLIASGEGWWCLPVCQQMLNYRSLVVPQAVQHLVAEIQGVSYNGSCFGKPLSASALRSLVWDQFASRLSQQDRQSVRGWLGIDFVADGRGNPRLIEVNPRLTSSYNLLRHLRWKSP